MNVVLYTKDFEPITVLDLPMWLLDQLERKGSIKIGVLRSIKLGNAKIPVGSVEADEAVTVTCDRIIWIDGSVKVVLTTEHEALALALTPDSLPGQVQLTQAYKETIAELIMRLKKASRK